MNRFGWVRFGFIRFGSVRFHSSRFRFDSIRVGFGSISFDSVWLGSPVFCCARYVLFNYVVLISSVSVRFGGAFGRTYSVLFGVRFGIGSVFGRNRLGLVGMRSGCVVPSHYAVYMFYHRARALLRRGSRSFGYLLACCSCCSICLFTCLPFLNLWFPGGCSVHIICTHRSSYVYLSDLRAVFVCPYHTV